MKVSGDSFTLRARLRGDSLILEETEGEKRCSTKKFGFSGTGARGSAQGEDEAGASSASLAGKSERVARQESIPKYSSSRATSDCSGWSECAGGVNALCVDRCCYFVARLGSCALQF